MPVYCVRTTT